MEKNTHKSDIELLLKAINDYDSDKWVSWARTPSKKVTMTIKSQPNELDMFDKSAKISDDIISKLQKFGKNGG